MTGPDHRERRRPPRASGTRELFRDTLLELGVRERPALWLKERRRDPEDEVMPVRLDIITGSELGLAVQPLAGDEDLVDPPGPDPEPRAVP